MSLTRCPHCQTVFRIDDEQLQARGGVVRCGQCQQIFQATRHLIDVEAKDTTATGTDSPPTSKPKKPRKKRRLISAHLPTIDELLGRTPQQRTRTIFWIIGIMLVTSLFLAQIMYFYSDDLSQNRLLRPLIVATCKPFKCKTSLLQDVSNIELADTQIRPHPKFKKALRINATLINRADFAQPYPLIEVTLTENSGRIIARKTFKPREYIRNLGKNNNKMPTNVSVRARLDVTSPGNRAQNYEIQLVANR
jgi:predicted Zn finger-like uncharacterized protein